MKNSYDMAILLLQRICYHLNLVSDGVKTSKYRSFTIFSFSEKYAINYHRAGIMFDLSIGLENFF